MIFKTLFIATLLQFGGDCPIIPLVDHVSIDVPFSITNPQIPDRVEFKLKWRLK